MSKNSVNFMGVELVTSSHRRFVTFSISDDSYVHIVHRTDNYDTARATHRRAVRKGYLEVVTVDFAAARRTPDLMGRVVPFSTTYLDDDSRVR